MVGSKFTPNRVPDVTTLPCAAREELHPHAVDRLPHVIENDGPRPPACLYCRETWADLDAALRATLPNRGRDPV